MALAWKPGQVRAPSCIADTEGARGHHPPVVERPSNAQFDALIARCIEEGGLAPTSEGWGRADYSV